MWTGEVSIKELREQGRWKVEFFCTETPKLGQSPYSLVALRELVEERRQSLKPQDYSEYTFNYIGLENVAPLTGDLIDFNLRRGKEVKSVSKVFKPSDILYGRLRPYLNKVYLAEEPVSTGICSGEFFVLIPDKEKILPHFLRAMLSSEYIQHYVGNLQTGSALPRLALDDLLAMTIPLPPMEVQQNYEKFLIAEESSRRELANKVVLLPQAVIGSVMSALEDGNSMVHLIPLRRPEAKYHNALPQDTLKRTNRKK